MKFIIILLLLYAYSGKGQTDGLKRHTDTVKPGVTIKTTVLKTVAKPCPCDPGCPKIDTGIRPLIGWVLIGGIIIAFLVVAAKSNLLRDQITDQATFISEASKTLTYKGETDPAKIPRPFSLSRSQLGLWTVAIGCSYLYIELCRGYAIYPINIDQGLLALMGISAATAAVGSMIDSSNKQVPHHQDGPSQGFFLDILSDQSGVSIHRFQNVIWTLIAVTIYIFQLKDVDCRHLPTLDSTLIALTGISSLTYLGLKINEDKPAVPPIVPPAGQANP